MSRMDARFDYIYGYENEYVFTVDQLLLKIYSVKNRTLLQDNLKRTSLQLLIFNGKTKYIVKKQPIKSEYEYGFVLYETI